MTLNLTHAECRERGAALTVHDYRVELDLRGAPDLTARTFPVTTTVTFSSTQPATWIDLVARQVTSATLNGQPLDVTTYDGARLPLAGLQDDNELSVTANCFYSRTGEGLHRFTDPEDEHTYLYTHLEPTDSRRLFACFEQPDLKARFTFVMTAPRQWTIVSGQPEASRTEDDTDATVTFETTPPQSSYITAVAAGPYHRESDSWSVTRADGTTQTVELGMLCRQSMAAHASADEIFRITRDGLDFFDEMFGFPYPWGKYDQIFVPEYNLGAMENPGLVTFTDTYLYRGRTTELQREQRAEVIMHEMSHMWFGDLATPRWWNDTWLKESFADLMGYQVAAEAAGFPGAWILFALGRKQWAYTQDERPTTHPVEAVIDDLEAARQNFDGITYAKGAAVMKQLQAYVGKDAFFAGARQYFADHAFGSTTLDDLLEALESASGRDLETWSRLWLKTAGPSVLTPIVESDEAGAPAHLAIRQEATDQVTGEPLVLPHRLRVGLYRLVDDRLTRTALLDVETDGELTQVAGAPGQPADLVLLNDDDLTYAVARLDEHSARVVATHLSTIDEPLSRGLVWSSLWNMVRDRILSAPDFVRVVLGQTPSERNATLLHQVLTLARTAVTAYTPEAARDDLAGRLVTTAREQLQAAGPGTDAQLVWARALGQFGALHNGEAQRICALLDGSQKIQGLPLDPDLRWSLATALTAQGDWGEAELAAELTRDTTMNGRLAHERALASRPGPVIKEQVWDALVGDTTLTNDRQRALLAGFGQPASAKDTAPFTGSYFDSLTTWWHSMPQTMATRLVQGLFPPAELGDESPERHPVVLAATGWLSAHPQAEAALRRTVTEALDDTLRALHCQARAQA